MPPLDRIIVNLAVGGSGTLCRVITKQLLDSRSESADFTQQLRRLFRLQEFTRTVKWVDESLRTMIVDEILIWLCGCEVH